MSDERRAISICGRRSQACRGSPSSSIAGKSAIFWARWGDTGPVVGLLGNPTHHGDKIWGGPPVQPSRTGDRFIEKSWKGLLFHCVPNSSEGGCAQSPLPENRRSIPARALAVSTAPVLQCKDVIYEYRSVRSLGSAAPSLGADGRPSELASIKPHCASRRSSLPGRCRS